VRDLVEGLDQPLLFVFFAGLAIFSLANIGKWAATRYHIPGLQAFLPQ
jgi:hypothetical protein